MKWLASRVLLGVVAAAGTITACTDGSAPTALHDTHAGVAATRASDRAEKGVFTTIEWPGATSTTPSGINNAGIIVGRYIINGQTHGWIRGADGELTTLDYPGATFTVNGGINDRGDIVGWHIMPSAPTVRSGFLLQDGVYTPINPPGSIWTNVLGINNQGDITGRYCTRTPCREPGSGDFHGFLYSDGEYTTIDVPGSIETNAWRITDSGEIVGSYTLAGGEVRLFTYRKGEFTTIPMPAGTALSADNGGLNARGDIVGKYCDASPCRVGPSGYAFLLRDGELRTFRVPMSIGTAAFAINNRGDIIGGYFDAVGKLRSYVTRLERE